MNLTPLQQSETQNPQTTLLNNRISQNAPT